MYFWNREDFLHIKATVNIKNKSLKEVILSKGKKILMLTAKKKNWECIYSKYITKLY